MTFPLPLVLSHLHVLLDLLGPPSKLRQLQILAVDLPPVSAGRPTFPVRITFPVFMITSTRCR